MKGVGLPGLLCVLAAWPAAAQYTSENRVVPAPNTGRFPQAGIELRGATFVNLGLQGIGRFPSSAKDPESGETIGSFSDLQITHWRRNPDGSYRGVLTALPDRGYNAGGLFSNYAARLHEFSLTFTPEIPGKAVSHQDQIALTLTAATRFRYFVDGGRQSLPHLTTGLLAGTTAQLFGTTVPAASVLTTAGEDQLGRRLTLDAEGLAFDPRPGKAGSGWIGEEYGGYIYHFDAGRLLDGIVSLPAALVPHNGAGAIDFGADPPANGRRNNQGVEGLAINREGTRLFALLQSATMQDSGRTLQSRANTRLLVYDVSNTEIPGGPLAEYVLQLPWYADAGTVAIGPPALRTAGQSAICVLSDRQLLILSRDSLGRGSVGEPVFKSVLLADLSAATNILGRYDAAGEAVAPGGDLLPGITPLAWREALNLLGTLDGDRSEISRFGLNQHAAPGDRDTLSEKWEGLALVSALDPTAPDDYFLFMSNDNDFQSTTGQYLDAAGTLQSYDSGLSHDSMVLAWRIRYQPATP